MPNDRQSHNFVFMQLFHTFVFNNPQFIWNTNINLLFIFDRFHWWNNICRQFDQAWCEIGPYGLTLTLYVDLRAHVYDRISLIQFACGSV